ncbi:MAG TPA: tetratricopeptide repeat protein, partial [Blastocatellia bacterium]|nr:tetratricopeptide repeat protein [Blastocatellia bacterium]
QVFFSFDLKRMIGQGGEFAELLFKEFGPWWLPIVPLMALAGFIFMFERDRAMFWFLALAIAGNLVYALNYEIAEDKDAYYLPSFLSITIAAGFGAQLLVAWIQSRNPSAKLRALAPAGLLVIPIIALISNLPYNNRSNYFIAEDYVTNIFKTVESNGLLLTQDWQVYSPMFYFQEVEKTRPDVIAIDVSLLRRSWYFDYLSRAYPELIERSRDKVDAFLATLKHWEQDPDIFNRDLTLNQRINAQFYDMIISFVDAHIQSAPVYITQDIAADVSGQNSELTKRLTEKYPFVPQGLVFQVMQNRGFHEPANPQLITRGLTDGTLKFADRDVVRLKVFPVYVSMLINRGRYLAAHKHHEQAVEAYNQALALDPDNRTAKQFLGESMNALRAAQ